MPYYLAMNGTNNYIKTPPITFDTFEMDISAKQALKWQMYMDSRTGVASYLQNNASGNDYWVNLTALFVNGVDQIALGIAPSTAKIIPFDTRCVIKGVVKTSGTDDVNIFSAQNNVDILEGRIYRIKFFNGAALVADYDANTQTLQDQSGNGNHATLNGIATWVEYSDMPTLTYNKKSGLGLLL